MARGTSAAAPLPIALVTLLFFLVVVPYPVAAALSAAGPCDALPTDKKTATGTFKYIPKGPQTVSIGGVNRTFELQLCTAASFTTVCAAPLNASAAFAVGLEVNTMKCADPLFTGVTASTTDGAVLTRSFNATAPSPATLTVTITCQPGVKGLVSNATNPSTIVGNTTTLNFYSETACPGAEPSPDDDNASPKLKTGAIVGIVIGVVGTVVLAAVIYQWRSKSIEEDIYNQV